MLDKIVEALIKVLIDNLPRIIEAIIKYFEEHPIEIDPVRLASMFKLKS